VKKIVLFCLYCAVFALLPAVSVLAQGGKDGSKGKAFPALEAPVEEGDVYDLSEMPLADDDEEDFSLDSEATALNKEDPKEDPPLTLEITVLNEDKSPPVPEISAVKEENKRIDTYSRGNADADTATSAAESAAAAAQFAAAAAQSAKTAESAAAAAAAAAAAISAASLQAPPSQPQPPPSQPPAVQPQPAPSRVPPQPPARTVVPTVNTIVPQNAPQSAPQNAPPPAAPPARRSSMNVTPGMPDPCSKSVYRVQVGAFSNTGLAQQCFNRLKSAGFTPYYEQYGSLYRVVITGIQAADMAGVIRRLESAGFSDAWIREER